MPADPVTIPRHTARNYARNLRQWAALDDNGTRADYLRKLADRLEA